MADDAEDRRAALAAAAQMASSRGDIGLRSDHDLHWLTLADEGYQWLTSHDTKEKTMTEDAAAAGAAEDVTAAESAPAPDAPDADAAEHGLEDDAAAESADAEPGAA